MDSKPAWQSDLPPSDARAAAPARAAAQRRTLGILVAVGLVADVAVAAWIALGPVEMPDGMRWPVASLIVASGIAGAVFMRRVVLPRLGA